VTYNTTGEPGAGLTTILQSIGEEAVNGFAKPIDMLVLQEQSTSAMTTQEILSLLNDIYRPETTRRLRWLVIRPAVGGLG
jgi:hypothetical protein